MNKGSMAGYRLDTGWIQAIRCVIKCFEIGVKRSQQAEVAIPMMLAGGWWVFIQLIDSPTKAVLPVCGRHHFVHGPSADLLRVSQLHACSRLQPHPSLPMEFPGPGSARSAACPSVKSTFSAVYRTGTERKQQFVLPVAHRTSENSMKWCTHLHLWGGARQTFLITQFTWESLV